jgi:hypothetical protein
MNYFGTPYFGMFTLCQFPFDHVIGIPPLYILTSLSSHLVCLVILFLPFFSLLFSKTPRLMVQKSKVSPAIGVAA